jgi:hypothetical protein
MNGKEVKMAKSKFETLNDAMCIVTDQLKFMLTKHEKFMSKDAKKKYMSAELETVEVYRLLISKIKQEV